MNNAYQHKIVFIPLHVYNETIIPLLGPDLYIWGLHLAVEFYNFDDTGVNCAIHGPADKVDQAIEAIVTINHMASSPSLQLHHLMMDSNIELSL